MGGGGFERDYVHALSDAEDEAAIHRVPEGGGVAHMRLRGEEELDGDFGGERGRGKEGVRLVEGG